MKKIIVPLVIIFLLCAGTPSSDAAAAKSCSTSIFLENDLSFYTDRNYTSGGLLSRSCTVSGSEGEMPDRPWLSPLRIWNSERLKDAKALFGVSETAYRAYSHYGGLSLYTPNSLNISRPGKEDGRPYASLFIYGDSVLHANDSLAIRKETQVGVMGFPLGGAIQKAVHDVFPGDDPQGWETEISRGGEPVVALALQGKYLLCNPDGKGSCASGPLDADVTASLGGSLGYYSSMRAGFSGRLGIIDSPFWGDYGPIKDMVLTPQKVGNPISSNGGGNGNRESSESSFEAYLFASGGLDLVLYSAVLQGQFRENDYEVAYSDLQKAVVTASFGAVFRLGKYRLSLSHSFRGPEIEGGEAHQWSSISAACHF